MYWQQFFKGTVDRAYVASRHTVGCVHAEIGLSLAAYLEALRKMEELFLERLRESSLSASKQEALEASLKTQIQLDATFVFDAFAEKSDTLLAEHRSIQDCLRSVFKDIKAGVFDHELPKAASRLDQELLDAVGYMIEVFRDVVSQAVSISQGDYSTDISPRSESDILGRALQNMTLTLRQASEVAVSVASGDYSRTVEVKGEKDILAQSMNQMVESLRDVVSQADIISQGNYSADISPRSEFDTLGRALQSMTSSLRITDRENKQRAWFMNGINGLSDVMRGDPDLQSLGTIVIRYLAHYLNAQIGALYTFDAEAGLLHRIGSYAFSKGMDLNPTVRVGEGLVGQCALEQEIISITDIPDDYIRVNSAIGNARPRHLVVSPFQSSETVAGVIELGSFQEISHDGVEFLRLVSSNIAIAIASARARNEAALLLTETQDLAIRLDEQQKELMASNEELEEQTQLLVQSEERLKRQQEELQVTNEELEEKNEPLERQRQDIGVKNDELERTRAEIEQKAEDLAISSKYKSEFLANMSHELRTPLNSMLLLARLLADNSSEHLDEEEVESATVIYRSGQDLLSLINEILDLSKIEAGHMDVTVQKIAVQGLADSVRGIFQHIASEKDLTLDVVVSQDVPTMFNTDGGRLEQIIRNLLSNALKFTEAGGVTVEIGRPASDVDLTRSGLTPGDTLAISVADTGIGIPLDKQKIIFEAFQQVEGGIARKYGGTGLGLSISRELARLLGGELQLTGSSSEGSTFTVYVPSVLPEKKISPVPTEAVNRTLEPGFDGATNSLPEGPQIDDDRDEITDQDRIMLVIEDDVHFAGIVRNLCHDSGFRCLVATSGEEGLELAERFMPQGIFLDIQLPGIDGWTVLDALKNNSPTRHIPVHIASVEDKTLDALRRSAVGYLQKPVELKGLEAAVQRLEDIFEKSVKELLIVEDDADLCLAMTRLIGNGDITITVARTGAEALEFLAARSVDCMILDLGLPDMTGFELLEALKATDELSPPVIVYTGKELTQEEATELRGYAESIIIKGVRSEERLLDETSLFLHRVVENLPEKKQRIIAKLRDTDEVLEGKRVLLVDDDMRNAFALSRVLSRRGVDVTKADNGQRALEILAESEFDLILMDIMMPVMDGYETIMRIREQPELQYVPIIALTAKAMREDREKCLRVGASDYLTKPVDIGRLCSMMRVWLYR